MDDTTSTNGQEDESDEEWEESGEEEVGKGQEDHMPTTIAKASISQETRDQPLGQQEMREPPVGEDNPSSGPAMKVTPSSGVGRESPEKEEEEMFSSGPGKEEVDGEGLPEAKKKG